MGAKKVVLATGIEIGLLLNFGATSLQVKRKYRTYREKGMSNPVNPVQVLENGVFK
jgi:hypothetical protein